MTTVVISDNTTGRDYTGSTDTFLHEDGGGNFGTETWITVSTYAVGDYNHGLIKFDGLSNIPSTATITSVTLELYQNVSDSSWDIALNAVLRNWVETQATWTIYSTGNSWTTAGATGSGDITASASATVTVANTLDQYYSFSSAQMATDVQGWVTTPSSNYGWLLRPSGAPALNGKQFVTSEGADDTRPKLTVVYTEGPPPRIIVPTVAVSMR